MKKFLRLFFGCLFCICMGYSEGMAQKHSPEFIIRYHPVDKDTGFLSEPLQLRRETASQAEALQYMQGLPSLLAKKGYPLASVDSFWESPQALHIQLYIGKKYNAVFLQPSGIESKAIEKLGLGNAGKGIAFSKMPIIQQQLLDYYEQTGYPFATVFLDSIELREDTFFALLKADKGILYHVDSIRILGNLKLKSGFLQKYLGIKNGSLYQKQILKDVDKRMAELPYVQVMQPADLSMLGSGSILNLYVNQKKSSRVNFLIGFLPNTGPDEKLQLTGDVNLDLKNMFGNGETILFKWQQLQKKSPRLNLGFNYPYIFDSHFGLNFLFDLFKKDSTYLQINAELGTDFSFTGNKKGSLFFQIQNTGLLMGGVDTNLIKITKELPAGMDMQAMNIGLQYIWHNTNYRLNPKSGSEFQVKTSVGMKKIKMNQNIINIKDNSFDYRSLYDSIRTQSYQLRTTAEGAHYFPLGKMATLKASVQAGYYQSPNIFRNELFQIGGYKTMRGFDEESIYANGYTVLTAEYRYLLSMNSYLFAFIDQGFVQNKWEQMNSSNSFTGAGLGIFFETGAGLINLSFAAGKRNDVKLNLRQAAKIHFGYINYF